MELNNFFYGWIKAELYFPHIRERTVQDLLVKRIHKTLLVYENEDLKWKAEYLSSEDIWVIVNTWCKSNDCWNIKDDIQFAQRIKVININEDLLSIDNMAD